MYLTGLTLTFAAVHAVDLPDVVGLVTDPVVWLRGQKFHEPLVHEPKKLMPTVDMLQDMTPHESEERFHFFASLFFLIFFTIIILGTGIMWVGSQIKEALDCSYRFQPLSSSRIGRVSLCSSASESSSEESSDDGDADGLRLESQRVLVTIAFGSTLLACGATGICSMATGTLSKNSGLDWEMYALLLAGGGIAVVVQAVFAVKWLPKGRTFAISTFAEAAFVSLAPFISDSFDTLKDTIFCCLCFESQFLVLKVIGAMSWLYLVAIHIYFIRRDDTLAELAGCYLPVLGALPKPEVNETDISRCESGWNAVMLLLYKQTTPTKQKLLIIENLPQALFSIIFLNLEGGSLFVKVINLGIPVAQIIAACILFRPFLNIVGPQLGNKLSAFLEKPDFLKARQLWDEAFRGDRRMLRQALPKLLEVPLVKDLLNELKPKEDAELDPNTDKGLQLFDRGLEAVIELQGELQGDLFHDALAAKSYWDEPLGPHGRGIREREIGPTICKAAHRGDVAAVRGWVRIDAAAVRLTNYKRDTPLHWAASNGHAEVVQVLLEAKASVEAKNNSRQTPLSSAAASNRIEVAKLLLAARASAHVVDQDGNTPLSRAKEKNNSDMVRLLEAA
eukprot:Skav225832  [mRNA]  locus=scaffold345:15014:16870:+ [translate_table: standard]